MASGTAGDRGKFGDVAPASEDWAAFPGSSLSSGLPKLPTDGATLFGGIPLSSS